MPRLNDQNYLRTEQYADARNLNARIRIHQEFSTNPYGWMRWVFDRLDLPPQARVLELGCGPGDLWRENAARIPAGWEVILSDFSPGMLAQAQENLSSLGRGFRFEVIDAQSIPYAGEAFDAVIANHFLYHVPDRAKAIGEMRRVLKPGGRLFAATVGENHLRELPALVWRFDPQAEVIVHGTDFPFSLENGAAQLGAYFSQVELHHYPDELRITDAETLTDYILSSTRFQREANPRQPLKAFIAQELTANEGLITIHKDSGMFVAQ